MMEAAMGKMSRQARELGQVVVDVATSGEATLSLGTVETPIGRFGAVFTEQGLGRLTFPDEPLAECEVWARRWSPRARRVEDGPWLRLLREQLTAYFRGDLQQFALPVDLRGTPFQLRVWEALGGIGYGELRSYAQIAAEIGLPTAVRAVGAANGANPVPIVVPCHRVIGTRGTLTGYGGGLDLKATLLRLEGVAL
jgi:methylated-DNA-[protein]-cysteine S-methyltransferase